MLLPLLLGLALQSPPADPEDGVGIRLEAGAWGVFPSGWIQITQGSRPGSGSQLRLDDDFDLRESAAPVFGARWEFLPSHAIGFQAALIDLSSSGTVEEAFIYHGTLFDVGRAIRVEQEFTLVDFGYEFTILRGDPIHLTAHAGGEYWSYSGHIRTEDALPPVDTKRSFDSGFWMAGIDIAWAPATWLDLRGLAIGGAERSHQNFFRLEAAAVVHPWTGVGFFLGYRYHALRFRQSTNESDLRFQGPTAGAELSF